MHFLIQLPHLGSDTKRIAEVQRGLDRAEVMIPVESKKVKIEMTGSPQRRTQGFHQGIAQYEGIITHRGAFTRKPTYDKPMKTYVHLEKSNVPSVVIMEADETKPEMMGASRYHGE
jgi:hypothetical protein